MKSIKRGLVVFLAVLLMIPALPASAEVSSTDEKVEKNVTNAEDQASIPKEIKLPVETVSSGDPLPEEKLFAEGKDILKKGNLETAEVPEVSVAESGGEKQKENAGEGAEAEGEPMPYADDIIASGSDASGNITWTLDGNGKLTVNGSGDFTSSLWNSYRESVTSVEVSVTGLTTTDRMFYECSSLESVDLSGSDTGNVTDMSYMFYDCSNLTSVNLSGIDTGNVTNMAGMFRGCSSLVSLDLSGLNTTNLTDMSVMFSACSSLTNLNLSGFNTGRVVRMGELFSGCSGLTSLDLSSFDTRNVTNMAGMFRGCSSLASLDISGIDTGNVTNMSDMFSDCSGLASLDLSGINTGNVRDMSFMFWNCVSLTNLDLSSLNTGNVADMTRMFENCRSLTELGLSNFDMRNVVIVDNMLSGCNKLTTIDAPLNLTKSVETPVVAGMVWRIPDGTEVTELPKDLTNSVVVTRHINPKIITTTTELNMEDVIRVKYVPYSYTVRTDNVDEENKVTFSLEAGELPRGMEIYPATGEIYGVPMEAGEFPITVKASYSNPEYEPSCADLTVIVKENTDGDVYNASDAGYDLIVPVGERAEDGSNIFILKQSGDQLFVSAGEFHEFIDLWLNGERLVDGVDYTKESGSTRITIRSQTFDNKAYRSGTNTLAMEFRVDGDKGKELRRTAQNFRMDSSQNNNGNGSGSNPGNGTGNENRNDNGNDISDITEKPVVALEEGSSAEIVTYTVVSGDTLWGIAKKFYSSGTYWQKIYADNAAVIRDPNRIYAGQVLIIYLSQKDENIITNLDVTDMEEGYYTVKKDDTFWKISEKVYGRGKNWRKIYDANRDKIKKPEQIYAGQVLVIPEG